MHSGKPDASQQSSQGGNSRFLSESGGSEGAKIGMQYSLLKNFGELEFDWEQQTVTMRAMGEDSASPLLSAKWTLDQLSGRAFLPGSLVSSKDYIDAQESSPVDGVWTCVNHRGRVQEMDHLLGHVVSGTALILLVPFPYLLVAYLLLGLSRRYRNSSKD